MGRTVGKKRERIRTEGWDWEGMEERASKRCHGKEIIVPLYV